MIFVISKNGFVFTDLSLDLLDLLLYRYGFLSMILCLPFDLSYLILEFVALFLEPPV